MKAMYKSELAELAGVSYSTFYRFLCTRRSILELKGSKLKDQKVRGKALAYICQEYDITLPDESPEPVKKHIKFH